MRLGWFGSTGRAKSLAMKTNVVGLGFLLLGWMGAGFQAAAAEFPGVALVIVMDVSGSMGDSVRDAKGQLAPKSKIAHRALEKIARQIEAATTKSASGAARKVQAGLLTFDGRPARTAVEFGPFDAEKLIAWARKSQRLGNGTRLGGALEAGVRMVLGSDLPRKHVLVITDGLNNVGPDPAAVLPGLKREAERKQAGFAVHFVAFDVAASVFAPVKKLGATVVGAADEVQLNARLGDILQHQILLEDEEPPAKKK